MSLSILQCTGRSETENDPVHSAGADDPGTGLSRGQPLLSPLLTGEDTEIQRQTWTHVALGPSTRSGAALPTPAPAGRPPLCLGIQSGAWALSLALGGTASPPGPGEASREDEVARAFGEISWARRSLGPCRAKARPRGLRGQGLWPHLLPPQTGWPRTWAVGSDSEGPRTCLLGPGIKPSTQRTHRPALCNTHALPPQRSPQFPSPAVHSSPQPGPRQWALLWPLPLLSPGALPTPPGLEEGGWFGWLPVPSHGSLQASARPLPSWCCLGPRGQQLDRG